MVDVFACIHMGIVMPEREERLVLVMAPESVPRVLSQWTEDQEAFDLVLDDAFALDTVMFVTETEWTAEVLWRQGLPYWQWAPIHRYMNFAGHRMSWSDVEDMHGYIVGRDPFCERYPSACRDA